MPRLTYIATLIVALFSLPALAVMPQIGVGAPDFIATDTHGNNISLSALKGNIVVLEWTNHKCPFVVKHYQSGNMQRLQKTATEQGVVWISIISSATGKQGHISAEEANQLTVDRGASPTHVIRDENGQIGHIYSAKTTPHMFVIDAKGTLAYKGAIDDRATADPKDVEDAANYVLAAVKSLNAGTAIRKTKTRPYGCSIKY